MVPSREPPSGRRPARKKPAPLSRSPEERTPPADRSEDIHFIEPDGSNREAVPLDLRVPAIIKLITRKLVRI